MGMVLSAVVNVLNICRHHDRPFQLLFTPFLRMNVIFPILAPFIFVVEYLCFIVWGYRFSDDPSVFLGMPVVPTVVCVIASVINIRLVTRQNRDGQIDRFKRNVNSDSVMLLESRREGVPEIVGDVFTDWQVRAIVESHYNGMFWAAIGSIVIAFVCNIPWLFHILGWT
jgi:hypothetical protein